MIVIFLYLYVRQFTNVEYRILYKWFFGVDIPLIYSDSCIPSRTYAGLRFAR